MPELVIRFALFFLGLTLGGSFGSLMMAIIIRGGESDENA